MRGASPALRALALPVVRRRRVCVGHGDEPTKLECTRQSALRVSSLGVKSYLVPLIRRMRSFGRAALVAALSLPPLGAFATPSVTELARELAQNTDARVRVQAALALGKLASPPAVRALLSSFDDRSAAVRLAIVAALRSARDPRAIPGLKARLSDRSPAVREALKQALKELTELAETSPKPRLLVKLGSMKNGSGVPSPRMESELKDKSRRTLAELPGVAVLESDPQNDQSDLPVVMVNGKIQELSAAREGTSIVYTASVEYVLETMPEQAIAAKVSGRASTTASEHEANDSAKSAELKSEVLEAAIASALRRAPPALLAAARL